MILPQRGLVFAMFVLSTVVTVAQEPTIRSTAVVDLSFDETDGPAEDRATGGTVRDTAQPMNGATRVTSPFWNVTAGQAARLNPSGNPFFQIADSADLDHAAGTTLSFYFLSLHELKDAVFHGITAKRQPNDQGSKTNYGLNFQPSSKKLQVYIHDGSGFKVVGFPLEAAFGVRRLAHLTATFRPGDAPAPDADTDADDLEIRLYVNGIPLKPMDAPGGTVTADAGWITDVNFAGLLNDTPLTIGASFPNGETVSGLFDEYLVFNRPLTAEEAAKLFIEVAGPDGAQLARREAEGVPAVEPAITNIVPRGLQVGATTRLTIAGRNLGPDPVLSLLGLQATAEVQPDSTTERLIVDVTVPADSAPTAVPLSVRTLTGLSDPVPLPIDRLPQRMIPKTDEPVSLPAAFTGRLQGSNRQRIAFDGTKGQTFVAEVELKRLGGKADPVLELKTDAGVPIDIAWGRSIRGGDPRLVTTLPADGRYVLELHDLAYQAANSPFHLLAGDLHLMDAVVPSLVEVGTTRMATVVGIGLDGQSVELASATGEPTAVLSGPAVVASHGVLPVATTGFGRVLDELAATAGTIGVGAVETTVAGQLVDAREIDRYALQTTAGQAIEIHADAKAIGSPVEPVLTVYEADREIERKSAQPGTGTVSVTVTPKTGRVEVRIGDRLSAVEGIARLYRLRIVPAGSAQMQVTLLDSAIVLPSTGRGVTRLRVERRGDVGPIRLMPDGASGVVIEPDVIPAGQPAEEVFVTVKAVPDQEIGQTLSLTAEAETPAGLVRRPVRVSPGTVVEQFDPTRPQFQVPIVVTSAAPSIELVRVPAVVHKGTEATIGLKVAGDLPEGYAVRFSLVSDEPPRPNDPKKPADGLKPTVRLSQDAAVPPGISDAAVTLLTPADVAVSQVRAVLKAEVVPHAWSNQVVAIGYSAPITLAVQDAIASAAITGSNAVKSGENQVAFAIHRHDGFAKPLRVELRGLPSGFAAAAVDLAADQSEATLGVVVPADAAAGPVPNVELAVLGPDGTVLKSIKPVELTVQP
ncbi:MAG: LamG-like jellyroll fold domain-containing protein [Planctomycetaceae bacterium]